MEKRQQALGRDRLAEDLTQLGLATGDMVYVHTSMKQIGWIDGGAGTLIDAFGAVLGAEGTLAAPTHTLSFLAWPPYDAERTPTSLGAFPEAVRRHPRALRSGHATHSSAAIGAQAAYLTANHDPCDALGYDSPLHRLYRQGGRIVLLGVTHKANTSLHLAEALSGVPYTRLPYDASWGAQTHAVQPGGAVRRFTQRAFPGCSTMFDRIAPCLPAEAVRRGKVGAADAILLEAAPLVDTAVGILRQTADFFLCASPQCPCCPSRHAMLEAEG